MSNSSEPKKAASLSDIKRAVKDPERLRMVRANQLARDHAAGNTRRDAMLQQLSEDASSQLHAPMAVISLVESEHDVLGGHTGLPDSYESTNRIDAQPSFCQLTVTSGEPVVITDTLDIPTLRLFPSVANSGVRAHLGIPLVINGQAVGNCCVLDFEPREWTAADIAMLKKLAKAAAARLTKLQQ